MAKEEAAIRQTISNRLAERMQISGMNARALAEKSEVSKTMIYCILNETKSVSVDILEALAGALDIPVSVLVS